MKPEEISVKQLGQLAGKAKPADLIAATIMEVKYDGHRIYAYRDTDRVRIFARSGVEKTGLMPKVERQLMALPVDTWVDGEACSFNEDGTNDWSVAQSVLGSNNHRPELEAKITYVVFDLLCLDGNDTRILPFQARRTTLENLFEAANVKEPVRLSPQFEHTEEAVQKLITDGHEGAIVKDPNSKYYSGSRGHGWYKVKATETTDVIVMGIKEGKGKYQGMVGALVFGQLDEQGVCIEQGACSGMTDSLRQEFTDQNAEGSLEGLIIEIAHMGRMPSGGLRHPQYKRTRTDKTAADCTIADQKASA